MGLFSNFGDALSGKIYKQNTLIGSNVAKLINKVESRQDFIKCWIYSCVASIDGLLDMLLFQDLKGKDDKGNEIDFNDFKKNIEKLNEQKVFEIFKLLSGHFLMVFLKNKDNVAFLKSVKLKKEDFEEEIITIFDFTKSDNEDYKKLDKKFSTNAAGYFLNLYDEIFSKGFEISSNNDVGASLVFSKLLSNSYQNFMIILQDKVKEIIS